MDRPFPHDTTLDGPSEDGPEPREERDPDEVRQQRLDDAEDRRRARQRAVDLAEKAGRLCPYGAEYVAGEWPFDPF